MTYILVVALAALAHAAELKGKKMNDKVHRAELVLENGKPVEGRVTFKKDKKAVFRAYNGVEVDIRIRPICAHGPSAEIESCWPNLAVELNDLTMRSGNLKVGEPWKEKKKPRETASQKRSK